MQPNKSEHSTQLNVCKCISWVDAQMVCNDSIEALGANVLLLVHNLIRYRWTVTFDGFEAQLCNDI